MKERYVWKDREKNCKALYRSGARSMPASLLALSLFPHSLIFSTLFPIPYCISLSVCFVKFSSIFASVSKSRLILSSRQLRVCCITVIL